MSAAKLPLVAALLLAAMAPTLNARAQTFRSIYSFQGGTDGAEPNGLVADGTGAAGVLYGTTSCARSVCNGTLFKMTQGGKETVIHSFGGTPDGLNPSGGLTHVGRHIYGVTRAGGVSTSSTPVCNESCGTIFDYDTTTKQLKIIYSFQGFPNDGSAPTGPLYFQDNFLYGTTTSGGAGGAGTVFKFDTKTGQMAWVQSFPYSYSTGIITSPLGYNPNGGLAFSQGAFYGTAPYSGPQSGGTAFKFTANPNSLKLFYNFGLTPTVGKEPMAGLIYQGGVLLGTANQGGRGVGSVFQITTGGIATPVYGFGYTCQPPPVGQTIAVCDGQSPAAPVVVSNGMIWGTTLLGGVNNTVGFGTVYAIDQATQAEAWLYGFTGGSDGASPASGLTLLNGALYGTTTFGGSAAQSNGTVFKIIP